MVDFFFQLNCVFHKKIYCFVWFLKRIKICAAIKREIRVIWVISGHEWDFFSVLGFEDLFFTIGIFIKIWVNFVMKQVLFLIVTLVSSVYFCCSKQLCRCVIQTLTVCYFYNPFDDIIKIGRIWEYKSSFKIK